MATPTKKTDVTARRILSILKRGNTRKSAYTAAGISHDTFATWIKDDEDFRQKVEHAEQSAIEKLVARVQHASEPRKVRKMRTEFGPPPKGPDGNPIPDAKPTIVSQTVEEFVEDGDWRAAKWLLETRDPENFAKQVNLKRDGDTIKGYGAGVDFDDL